jgi:transposase
MFRINLSDGAIAELQTLKKTHAHPSVRLKAEVLLLKSLGYSHAAVEKITGVSRFTIKNYLKSYQTLGLSGLTVPAYHKPVSKLAPYTAQLKAHFEQHPAFSIAHAIEEIEKITGYRMSPTRTGVFMKQIGLKFLKTGAIPAKQMDTDKQVEQAEFEKKL